MAGQQARPVGLLRRLRFRFGFYIHREAESARHSLECLADANWTTHTIGGFKLWTHPETECVTALVGDISLAIVGDAFPNSGTLTLTSEIDRLTPDDASLNAFVAGLGGRFAMLAVIGDRVRVFHDPVGSRSVFYRATDPVAVASHIALLAAASGATRSSDMADYMADAGYLTRRAKYLPGDYTPYADILALRPNMLYDSDRGGTVRYWPFAPRASHSEDDFRAAARDSFAGLAAHIGPRHSVLLGLSGGVDCRLALALMQSAGLEVHGTTWPYGITPGETDIINRLVSSIGLNHRYITLLREPGQIGKVANLNDGRLGTRVLAFCPTLRKAYRSMPNPVLVRGWGAEIMRGSSNTRLRPMRSFDPSEMTRIFLSAPALGGRTDKIKPSQSFRARTLGYFEAFVARGSYADVHSLGYDPNDIYFWEHRLGMWCASEVNQTDAAFPNYVAFNSRPMFEAAFGLPAKRRLSKGLFLDLATSIDPRYTSVPITKPEGTLRSRLRRLVKHLPRWR